MSDISALQSVMADQIVELKAENARLRATIQNVRNKIQNQWDRDCIGWTEAKELFAILADSPEVGETPNLTEIIEQAAEFARVRKDDDCDWDCIYEILRPLGESNKGEK